MNDGELIAIDGIDFPGKPGLTIPEATTQEGWENIGRQLGRVESSYQFMVGDWWNFGDQKWGNRKHIVDSPSWSGPRYNTCRNCGWVRSAFKMSLRRDNLTFAHHQEITPLWVSNPSLPAKSSNSASNR
jgi:hypothetical protein